MPTFIVSNRAVLEDICARAVAANAPQLPLYRAAADELIALFAINDPALRWPADLLAEIHRPAVVLVGADVDGIEPDPPAERWACARALCGWAHTAIINGAGGDPAHYRMGSAAAVLFHRLAFIECRSEHVLGWASLPWKMPPLVIAPSAGSHPVRLPRGAMQ